MPPPISAVPNMPSRTGTPGLSTGLVASLLAHSVRLALVLSHAGVDLPVRLLAHLSSFSSSCAVFSYWTMSARMGALKTLGRVTVLLEAEPSAPMTVTVGRDMVAAVVSIERRWYSLRLSSPSACQ